MIVKAVELSREGGQPWLQAEVFGCKQTEVYFLWNTGIYGLLRKARRPLLFCTRRNHEGATCSQKPQGELLASAALEILWREPGLTSVSAGGLDIQPLQDLDLDPCKE